MNKVNNKKVGRTTKANFMNRALSAYFRQLVGSIQLAMQPSNASAIERVGDRRYVVLRNVEGTLAVYRVRSCDKVLKRLKRWPKLFDQNVEGGTE